MDCSWSAESISKDVSSLPPNRPKPVLFPCFHKRCLVRISLDTFIGPLCCVEIVLFKRARALVCLLCFVCFNNWALWFISTVVILPNHSEVPHQLRQAFFHSSLSTSAIKPSCCKQMCSHPLFFFSLSLSLSPSPIAPILHLILGQCSPLCFSA